MLVELTHMMFAAGIPIMAGSDIGPVRADYRPGQSVLEEIAWLRKAGLSEKDARDAASTNVKRWLGVRGP